MVESCRKIRGGTEKEKGPVAGEKTIGGSRAGASCARPSWRGRLQRRGREVCSGRDGVGSGLGAGKNEACPCSATRECSL